jgi:pimeloyl-ACP methyl ester carboxylesterase
VPHYAADDGARLHYDVLGDASSCPILVLAGGAARHPHYLGDLAGLSERYRLIVPHLRGVGDSGAADVTERGSYWRQAEDIDRLQHDLGLDRCIVAGHSAGTRLAISFAAQFPGQLSGLLLITPPTAYLLDVPSDTEAMLEARHGDPGFEAAVAARDAGPDTSSNETFNGWQHAIAPLGYASFGPVERAHDRTGGDWSLAAARAYLAVDPPVDLADRLRRLDVPTLVIAGADDLSTGVAPVVAVAGLFSAGRIVVIHNCGHHPWVEQPKAFREAVDPFLDAVCHPTG